MNNSYVIGNAEILYKNRESLLRRILKNLKLRAMEFSKLTLNISHRDAKENSIDEIGIMLHSQGIIVNSDILLKYCSLIVKCEAESYQKSI